MNDTTDHQTTGTSWRGPIIFSAIFIAFACIAPFALFEPGTDPTAYGISLVIAEQAGRAIAFLLLGLITAIATRFAGYRNTTWPFIIGTTAGLAMVLGNAS